MAGCSSFRKCVEPKSCCSVSSAETTEVVLSASRQTDDPEEDVAGFSILQKPSTLSGTRSPWWLRRGVGQERTACFWGEGRPDVGPLLQSRDASLSARRKEVATLWQRLAQEGAWTVDLFLLLLKLGFGARSFLATACAGFDATHLARVRPSSGKTLMGLQPRPEHPRNFLSSAGKSCLRCSLRKRRRELA